jgi:hypothetical protein
VGEGMTLTIEFGALCKPIGEQLKAQGIVIPDKSSDRFEKITQCITRLHLNGIIPDGARDNARKKLMKEMVKTIESEIRNGSKTNS